jgi:hypothetical protein
MKLSVVVVVVVTIVSTRWWTGGTWIVDDRWAMKLRVVIAIMFPRWTGRTWRH